MEDDERKVRKMERLTPTNIVTDGDDVVAMYRYRASGEIALEAFGGEVDIEKVKTQQTDDGLRWQYGDYTPVYLRKDGIYAMEDTQETRVQAYFALSWFDSKGMADMRSRT